MAGVEMKLDELQKVLDASVEKGLAPIKSEIDALKAQGKNVSDLEAEMKVLKDAGEKKKSLLSAEWESLMESTRDATAKGEKTPDTMTLMGQYIMAGVAAINEEKGTRQIDKQKAVYFAQKMYPESKALHGIMQKDLTAGVPSAGGYTIPQVLSQDVVNALYANTILEKLGVNKVPMPNGNMRLARMDTSASVGWVGEVSGAASTQPVFGDINLQAKKLYALSLVSNSLLRYNTVGMDSWIARDLAQKAAIALDYAMLYGAGNSYQPLGLANVANIQTYGSSSTAVSKEAPVKMLAKLKQANTPMLNPRWIMSPYGASWFQTVAFASGPFAWANEMLQNKTLAGVPFVESSTVSYTDTTTDYADFWVGDFSELVWGVGYDISLEISREGTYVASGTTYSAFQRDETIVRLIAEHDFAVKHPTSFVKGILSES